jgi:hypothetical protein
MKSFIFIYRFYRKVCHYPRRMAFRNAWRLTWTGF